LAQLIDKKAAIIGDARIDGDTRELVDMLLSLSGEDAISIERKYRDDWHGTAGVRFFLMSNELPGFTDASGAIASRFILFRFRQSFTDNPDPQLTEKLLSELPGILNWAIEGLHMLREDGRFIQPASSAEMIELMEDIASPTLRFIKDCCIIQRAARSRLQSCATRTLDGPPTPGIMHCRERNCATRSTQLTPA
jgi:putative DNA primase/helicase